jgi:hypothetical protein
MKGTEMKKSFASTVAAGLLALSCTAAFGADMMPRKAVAPPPPPPSPWDIAFGASGASDYIWRGITQSNHKPSVTAYTELRYNFSPALQVYGGMAGNSISFPNRAAGEFDFFGGFRPTFGPIALDFGAQYYYYPGGTCYGGQFATADCLAALPNGNYAKKDWSFWEVYSKGVWTINDQWALGYNVFGTSNILNTGASGTYVSGTLKYTAPTTMAFNSIGWYVSGEFGEQFLGTSDSFYGFVPGFGAGVPYADYATWNVGLGFTWKVFTLDLRYSGTDLSKADCNVYTSDHTATFSPANVTATNPGGMGSKWCDARFVAKLSFDMTLGALK